MWPLAAFIAATGIVVALSWYGMRRGEWWAWMAAVVSPVVGLAVAVPYHYFVGALLAPASDDAKGLRIWRLNTAIERSLA